MKRLLGLNGELPDNALARRFDGVGLVRGEYLCRQADAWVTTVGCLAAISSYLDTLAARFAGRPVWYRLVDMESNEVSTLPGCTEHIVEKTTMLGMRGVRRGLRIPEELACELGMLAELARRHDNIHLLLPFVSDATEVARVLVLARELGFRNRIGVMAETPAAILTLPALVEAGAQEVVIGMNDLTSLTLGSSRDLPLYRKDHAAVLTLVRLAVEASRACGVPLHAAGYLDTGDIARLEQCGIESVVVHYSLLGRLWPSEFDGIEGTLDLTAIKSAVREKVNDPRIIA